MNRMRSLLPRHRPRLRRHFSREVEVKLRLPDLNTHRAVLHRLSPYHTKTLVHKDVFFEGRNNELAHKLAALRLRFYQGEDRCHLTLKSKPYISDGVSRIEEQEEPFNFYYGLAAIAKPAWLLSDDSSQILERVKIDFQVAELICLGEFRNVRTVFEWEGLKLEVDETHYDFGTSYEIECESSDSDKAKKLIDEFLGWQQISYFYSEMNKFAIFRSGKLLV